jgi:hypothetical protein
VTCADAVNVPAPARPASADTAAAAERTPVPDRVPVVPVEGRPVAERDPVPERAAPVETAADAARVPVPDRVAVVAYVT